MTKIKEEAKQHLLLQSWKSNNYMGSNRENSNIAFLILEKWKRLK